jgi:predicted AAA+ superfamily ATPase
MIVIEQGIFNPPVKVQWANLAGNLQVQQQQSEPNPNPVAVIVATGGTTAPVTTLEYSPPSAQAVWAIAHNLGRYPIVTVTDSNKLIVEAEISYLDLNLIEIRFAYPASGYAYIV